MEDAAQNFNALPPVDLLIVGGGPTGLFASFYAGMRQMSVKIVDSLDVLGGQLLALYPEKYIYDAPGFPRVLAKDLAAHLIAQGLQYSPAVCLGEQVAELRHDPGTGLYTVLTHCAAHPARTILIAAGVGAFQPRRLALPDVERYEGRGLYYSVSKLEDFRDQRVLIVGGGDSAVDWANALAPIAGQLTLIHRRDQFRAHEHSVARLHRSAARVHLFHELKALAGEGRISHATIYDNRSKYETLIEVDAVLVNIGFVNALGPIADWGLELDGAQIRVDSRMRTSRPGIFAAGDIATHPGKLKLIATGFGEAAIAVNHAKHHLDPRASVFPGHSTSLKR